MAACWYCFSKYSLIFCIDASDGPCCAMYSLLLVPLAAIAATADENVMATVETSWFTQVYEAVTT